MTKSSQARIQRRIEELKSGDALTFGDVMPLNTVFPEDIPRIFVERSMELAGCHFHEVTPPDIFSLDGTQARSRAFRRHWQGGCQDYILRNWASFLQRAREELAAELNNPQVSEVEKEKIADAFIEQSENRNMVDFSEHLAPGAVH